MFKCECFFTQEIKYQKTTSLTKCSRNAMPMPMLPSDPIMNKRETNNGFPLKAIEPFSLKVDLGSLWN